MTTSSNRTAEDVGTERRGVGIRGCTRHWLEEDFLVLGFFQHVLREPFEEARVFALVDGAQNGRRRPATGIH